MAQRSAMDQMCTFFAVVHDPRRQHPTTLHPLETILTITILATSGGGAEWGRVGARRVTSGTFPHSPLRTGRATFTASGSPEAHVFACGQ
jgi:hypothetical protein